MTRYKQIYCENCNTILSIPEDKSETFKVCAKEKCCGEELEVLEVVASYGICNIASLNVYKQGDYSLLVGVNDQKPEWCPIEYYTNDDREDADYLGIKFGDCVYYLSEFMRV